MSSSASGESSKVEAHEDELILWKLRYYAMENECQRFKQLYESTTNQSSQEPPAKKLCLDENDLSSDPFDLSEHYKTKSEQMVALRKAKQKNYCRCGRGFNQKSNLIRHQKSVGHLDAATKSKLKYPCENCKQKFFSLNGLKKHKTSNACNNNE